MNFRLFSYEQIGKLIRRYTRFGGVDALRFFEEVLFCYLTGNNDMHLKNFSLLREPDGAWNLSPAYDLVPAQIHLPKDSEELALTLNGKKRRLVPDDFAAFAASLHLSDTQFLRTVRRLTGRLAETLDETLARSFLSQEFQSKVRSLVASRFRVFE